MAGEKRTELVDGMFVIVAVERRARPKPIRNLGCYR